MGRVRVFIIFKTVGFVPQSDAMTAEMSVKEMLDFNPKYRLSSDVSHHYQKSVVRDVLKLLKIRRIRHSSIGDDIKRGISGGQKKRVNIGMELVSQPSVIFLDEPTSGLDSTTSNDVMEVLQLIANRGTLVLVVLHQPRYEIFNAFDNIVLLAEGGKMVYMGDTQNAMPYFEQFGYAKPDLVNPADFMMVRLNIHYALNTFMMIDNTIGCDIRNCQSSEQSKARLGPKMEENGYGEDMADENKCRFLE